MAISEEKLRLIIEAEVTKALANVQTMEKALTHMAGGVDTVTSKSGQVDHLGSSFGKLNVGAAGLLGPLTQMKGLLPGIGFATVATGVFKTAAAFQTAREQFGILLQDAEAGDKVFENLLDFNAKTPFSQSGLNAMGVQLLNAKVSAEALIPTMRQLGDLSKGNELKFATLGEVYGRVNLKGKVSGEELNRVLEAGVPITQALGEAMGVAENKIFDMTSKGEVGADAFRAAIDRMTGAGGQYNGMMDKMAANTEGKFSTAMGNVEILAGVAGEQLDGMTKAGLDGFIGLTEGAINFMKAADPLVRPLADMAGLLGGGVFKVSAEVFNSIADGMYLISGNSSKTRSEIRALEAAVAGTNSKWEENIKVYQTLSSKQGRTKEETEAMRTAYMNLKTMLPGVTEETLKYALATGRVAEAMKLQEMASTLTSLSKQAQDLGVKSTTAAEKLVSGLLGARENLKRTGATALPYSLDFELNDQEFGKLDGQLKQRAREFEGKHFISISDLGFLDDATKKTALLRKAEEMASGESKSGMKLKAESYREMAAEITAETKAREALAKLQEKLAGSTKDLFAGIRGSGIVAPLKEDDLTTLEKWNAAWKDYSDAFDAAERGAENMSLSQEELEKRLSSVKIAFIDAVDGLEGLTSGQVGVIRSVLNSISLIGPEAEDATEDVVKLASSLEEVQKSLDGNLSRFGDFGRIASQALKAFAPEQAQRDIDDFLTKYGAGFGALFDSIGATATLAFETFSEEESKALEREIELLERQKEAYKRASDNEIAILEDQGLSTVDARLRQAAEEARIQGEIDKKKSALARKQFESEKQTKLAQIAMATALGIANTISAGPWAIPLTAGILTLGGIQAGIVNSQRFPEAFNGAMIQGSPEGTVIRTGERNQAELVLPLREEKLRELGISGGSGVTVGQLNVYSNSDDPAEVARQVIREMDKLTRTGR